LLNINPGDLVVIVYGEDRIRDATLIAMVFERLGHFSYGILEGGFDKWASEGRPVSNELPAGGKSNYTSVQEADRFTLGYREVLQFVNTKSAIILDVRPADYFNGKKSDEARAGHIPGAVNRDFKNDLEKHDRFVSFKSAQVLEPIYAGLIPTKNHSVVVHCRTGHQASQTFFVLKNLLQYQNVFWYDAGWTEWASRKELPIATDAG
nr:sulfurtransferase [Deltaproteobacteria bacterium]